MQTRMGPRCPAGMPPEGEQESYSMKTIMIGDYIKRRRVELGMTQGQLAKGICTVATLSRLEAGIQTPRRNRISALLQRLGLPDSRYFAINTQEEVAIEAYKKDIVACNVLERVEEGFEKLQKLEQLLSPDDNLTRQFVVRSRALLGGLDGRYTHGQQMEMLLDAMRMTIPDFSLEDLEEHYYTFDEIKTLNQIAGLYLAEDQMEQALHLYDKLLNYILNHNQALLCRNGLLPMVLHNYTRALNIAQRYADGGPLRRGGPAVPAWNMGITSIFRAFWLCWGRGCILPDRTAKAQNVTGKPTISTVQRMTTATPRPAAGICSAI